MVSQRILIVKKRKIDFDTIHGDLNPRWKQVSILPGNCSLKLALSACRFNLLFDPPTTAGLLGDTDDATEVPPDDFRDSLEASAETK